MSDWHDDLKKYVVRKHKELTGEDLPIELISDVNIDFDVEFNDLSIHDLGNMYAFALMMENYEFAEKIHNELKSRGCKVDVDLDDKKKSGIINIAYQPQTKLESININMKLTPTGIVVDFDKLDQCLDIPDKSNNDVKDMSYYIVDVETDGEIPPKYSMVCFGVVKLTPELDTTFYGKTRPISDLWIPNALAISGFSREEHMQFDDPKEVMKDFANWIESTTKGRAVFVSDNNGFDFAWINYYFHTYLGRNPFGWSSRRIGDIYCGMKMDMFVKWKWLRETVHDHNPVNDAMGNAQALLKMKEMGLKINTK